MAPLQALITKALTTDDESPGGELWLNKLLDAGDLGQRGGVIGGHLLLQTH